VINPKIRKYPIFNAELAGWFSQAEFLFATVHCFTVQLSVVIPMWADRLYLGWLLRLVRQPRVFGPRYLSARKLPWLLLRHGRKLPPLRSKVESKK
jgi:hypothetical protein